MPVHIVMTSTAKMPNSCWGKYRNVAVLLVENDCYPKMISDRAKGVIKIVRHWGPQNVGTTQRCAFHVALTEAEALADELNYELYKASLS